MAEEFNTQGMLDIYLFENGQLLERLQEIVLEQKDETCFDEDAINEIFDFVRSANKFFDSEQPWITRNTDKSACDNTLYQCVQIIINLAILLSPFLPFSSDKVLRWFHISAKWEKQSVSAGYILPEIEILFQRIDKKVIEEETEKLKSIL